MVLKVSRSTLIFLGALVNGSIIELVPLVMLGSATAHVQAFLTIIGNAALVWLATEEGSLTSNSPP